VASTPSLFEDKTGPDNRDKGTSPKPVLIEDEMTALVTVKGRQQEAWKNVSTKKPPGIANRMSVVRNRVSVGKELPASNVSVVDKETTTTASVNKDAAASNVSNEAPAVGNSGDKTAKASSSGCRDDSDCVLNTICMLGRCLSMPCKTAAMCIGGGKKSHERSCENGICSRKKSEKAGDVNRAPGSRSGWSVELQLIPRKT
jgi:hypothetical protein